MLCGRAHEMHNEMMKGCLQLLPLLGSLRDERLQRRTDGGFDQVGSLLPDHDRRGIGIPVHNGGKNLNVKRILLGI